MFPASDNGPDLMDHYPLRSVEHGKRKINHQRNDCWAPNEVRKGWHSHYADLAGEDDLIWEAANLHDSRIAFWERHGLQICLICDVLSGPIRSHSWGEVA